MRSDLFAQENQEKETGQRYLLQSSKMLKVELGQDVLALKGAMVAFQGNVTFNHEGSGSMGKLLKKMVSSDDVPLMRVAGQGEVFFAERAADVFLIQLEGDAITVNGRSLLAFDANLDWDIKRVQGAGVISGGMFNTVINGTGTVALVSDGPPMLLNCAEAPTYVDMQAAVAWSANLVPNVVSSMNVKSMLKGGSGEAAQYAFSGQGFVVVQPSEGVPPAGQQQSSGGGALGGLLNG
jgi:uncharacterized protein (AIM24 family)